MCHPSLYTVTDWKCCAKFGWSLSMLLCHTCIDMHPWVCWCMHMITQTQTHKHGCCSSNLLGYRADITAHHHHWSRPAPQKTGRAQPSGPVVWSETHRWVRQTGRRKERPHCTLILTFRLWAVDRRALLLVQKTLRAQRGFGVQVLLVWTRLLHLWQPARQILSTEKQMTMTSEEWETGGGPYIIIQKASLLLLFDGLDAFHQVLLSLCVWVQRFVLGDHTQIRTDLLVHLQKRYAFYKLIR